MLNHAITKVRETINESIRFAKAIYQGPFAHSPETVLASTTLTKRLATKTDENEHTSADLEHISADLEPTRVVLEPTGASLEPMGAVLEPTGVVLEPTGAVLGPTDVILRVLSL